MEEMDLQFFTRFNEAKKMFIMVSNQAKKEIILQEEDDFIESMARARLDPRSFPVPMTRSQ